MTRVLLSYVGVMVFAATGVLSAGRKGMDLIGVAAIAVVTALGGGTLRDILLERHPVFWIGNTAFLWACFAATAITLLYVRHSEPPAHALQIADALGLALFTIGGTQIAQDTGATGLIMVLMGVLTGAAGGILRDVLSAEIPLMFRPGRLYATAAAGGILRDVLSAEIPLMFRPGRLYATAALAGAVAYELLDRIGVHGEAAAVAGMTLIAGLRIGAIYRGWRLPTLRMRAGPHHPGT